MNNADFKILIVDDERFNIEVVVGFLEPEAYTLSYVNSGEDALRAAFNNSFDLILLDINMPGIDGFTVCERLKKDAKTKEIPIIFLSAQNDINAITRAFSIGAVDYVSKPFNGLELIARVHNHVRIRSYILEIEAKQNKLAQLASTDTLTKVANRLRFISRLKQEAGAVNKEQSRLSLIYINLDNVQKINDIYGYSKGDKILFSFAQMLKKHTRETDFLARIFGAEFAIILPNTSKQAAKHIAQKIKGATQQLKVVPTSLSCSLGVVEYQLGESGDAFLVRGEKQMQEAKELGGNMVAHDQK